MCNLRPPWQAATTGSLLFKVLIQHVKLMSLSTVWTCIYCYLYFLLHIFSLFWAFNAVICNIRIQDFMQDFLGYSRISVNICSWDYQQTSSSIFCIIYKQHFSNTIIAFSSNIQHNFLQEISEIFRIPVYICNWSY